MSGKLYALSTGPGAADLITVRAARTLGALDILMRQPGVKVAIVWRCRLCGSISVSRPRFAAAISR